MNSDRFDIFLVYPGQRMAKPRLPMSVLALASYCREHGYRCKIVDERVEFLDENDIASASVIGISTMSGMQLRSAIATARRIKRKNPSVPLVWGGAHPSSFPEQTAKSPLVDCVVKGEGEEVFLRLCERILNKRAFDDIASITFKRDGEIIDNPKEGQWLDMDDLPFPSYELFDMKRYADYEEGLSYESSRGCLFRCTFCYVEYFHHRQWRGKSVKKVIDELQRIKKEIGVKKIAFVDDNFFGDKKRNIEICSQMIEKSIDVQWASSARADFLSRCSQGEMALLQKSKCEILSIGAESGSPHVLAEIKKDITPQQIKDAVRACVDNAIMPTVSFVIGLPFETENDLEQTLLLYDELMAMGNSVEANGLFLYVPYAGTSLFATAIQFGYRPKENLEAWGEWNFSDVSNNPWISPRLRSKYTAISSIARFKYLRHRFEFYSEEFKRRKLQSPLTRWLYRLCIGPFAAIVEWRWRRRFFLFPIELYVWRKLTYTLFKIR